MSTFGETVERKSRQERQCEGCGGTIPAGELHHHFAGMHNGEWQNWRMHAECYKSYSDDGYEEFLPHTFEMPDRVRLLEVK